VARQARDRKPQPRPRPAPLPPRLEVARDLAAVARARHDAAHAHGVGPRRVHGGLVWRQEQVRRGAVGEAAALGAREVAYGLVVGGAVDLGSGGGAGVGGVKMGGGVSA
jgi:hypothetical protein